MSDNAKPITVGKAGLGGFLENAVAYDICDSVMAVLDAECNVLYQNSAYVEFSKALLIDRQFPRLKDIAYTIESLQDSVSACVLNKSALQADAQVYYQRQISIPLRLLLRPIFAQDNDDVLAIFVSLTDENIRYDNYRAARKSEKLGALQSRIQSISVENHEQQQLIRTLLNDTPFAIMMIDGDNNITQVNRACENILSISGRDIIGHSRDRYLSSDETAYGYSRVICKPPTSQYESLAICANGTRRNILRSSVHFGEGQSALTLEAFIDITDNKNIEEEIVLYRNHLEELVEERTAELDTALSEANSASKAKSEFLSRVSHELRTPLNAILGFAQLLGMETNNYPHLQGQVDEISTAGKHLLNLVNEILDLSQIEQGRVSINLKTVPLQDTLEETIKYVEPLAKINGIMIKKMLCGQPCKAIADPLRLREVLLNLLSNAVKYNRVGGQVLVACDEDDNGHVAISITDTGQGLSAEQMSQLFEPFSRLGAEYTEIEGSGIGLTIVKRMVELMDGTIAVESKKGEGSCFTVYLPSAIEQDYTESLLQVEKNYH